MQVVPSTKLADAEAFALASGLMTALVVRKVPLARLAAAYGYPEASLRARLWEHATSCLAALAEPPTPRVRERVISGGRP